MAISQMRSKGKKFLGECERLKQLIELVRPHNLDTLFLITKKTCINDEDNNKKGLISTMEINVNKNEEEIIEEKPNKKQLIESQIVVKPTSTINVDEKTGNEIMNSTTTTTKITLKVEKEEEVLGNVQKVEQILKKERNYEPAGLPPINYPKFGLLKKSEAIIKNSSQIKQKRQKMKEEVFFFNYYFLLKIDLLFFF